MPRAACSSVWKPSPSGPRWTSASHMRRTSSASGEPADTIPAIPHIGAPAGLGRCGHAGRPSRRRGGGRGSRRAPSAPRRAASAGSREHPAERVGQRPGVGRRNQEPAAAQQLAGAADVGGDHRAAGGHRLHDGVAHALVQRRQHHDVRPGQQRLDVGTGPEEPHVDAQARGLLLQRRALRPVADQGERAGQVPVAQPGDGRRAGSGGPCTRLRFATQSRTGDGRVERRRGGRLEGRVRQAVVDGRDLVRAYAFVAQRVLGHGVGVRHEQVGHARREAFDRQQHAAALLEVAEAAAARDQHLDAGEPRRRGGRHVAVEQERVQDVGPVAAAGGARAGRRPRRWPAASAARTVQGTNPRWTTGTPADRSASSRGPPANITSTLVVDAAGPQALGEQDELLLGAAEAELADQQADTARATVGRARRCRSSQRERLPVRKSGIRTGLRSPTPRVPETGTRGVSRRCESADAAGDGAHRSAVVRRVRVDDAADELNPGRDAGVEEPAAVSGRVAVDQRADRA